MYYFIGRVATLTKKENECRCTFNVETSVKINGEYIPIAYAENKKEFTRAPGSFAVDDGLFAFISQHSREKLKIGFEIDTGEQGNSAESEASDASKQGNSAKSTASGTGEQGNSAKSTASGTGEQGNSAESEKIGTIKEVTLQNE